MRGLGFAVVLLVGCVTRGGDAPGDPFGDPPIFTPPSSGCHDDSACKSGQVCARTGACLPADQVRAVHVSWTVRGMPAGADTCASAPDLEIELEATTGSARLAFLPVPCVEGKFSVDKAPTSIDHVTLGRASGGGWQATKIDAITGEAALDLPY